MRSRESILEPVFVDGFLEEEAQVRFSDFTKGGKLQHSRCLMYFEKSRFRVSELSGITDVLRQDFIGSEPAFVVTRADIDYIKPVRIVDAEFSRKLLVRTRLVFPVISKLAFIHQLVDAKTGQILIEAKVDTVVLLDGKMVMKFSDSAHECLNRYMALSGYQEENK